MRFSYDLSYDPPAPACPIILSTLDGNSNSVLPVFLDTGADTTIVPIRHLKAISARRAFAASLRSQWGERRQVFLYLVDIHIAGLTLPGVYVVGDEIGDEVVLGHSVLNRLRLLLDGPSLTAIMLDSEEN